MKLRAEMEEPRRKRSKTSGKSPMHPKPQADRILARHAWLRKKNKGPRCPKFTADEPSSRRAKLCANNMKSSMAASKTNNTKPNLIMPITGTKLLSCLNDRTGKELPTFTKSAANDTEPRSSEGAGRGRRAGLKRVRSRCEGSHATGTRWKREESHAREAAKGRGGF